ncbi:MAG: hypothetical protein HY940_05715 [Gammaproteobacteria bacterium]|nr:hypothetical protein [Gammaproteobacteria bacterium]
MREASQHHNTLKRILILHKEGNLFNNPSLKCIVDLLLYHGCAIDYRYSASDITMPYYEGVRYLPYGPWLRRLKYVIFGNYYFKPFVFLSVLTEKIAYYKNYDLIIGIDRLGLIEASVLNKITRVPYIFISFEILFEDETSSRFKLLEKEASHNVAMWLVQDQVRAAQLQHENLLNLSKQFLLPLASAGLGMPGNDRLRDRLGIPKDKKVAIVIGSISKWAMTSQILKCVADWPDEWVLIIHARYGQTREMLSRELDNFENLLDHKIFISNAASDMVDDMGSVFAGISAGLALYQPEYGKDSNGHYLGMNLQHLGLASGKISTYLRYGIPVIINEVGLYADEARKFRFGCVVERPEQIKDCLNEIRHEEYHHAAENYYANKLDFNIYRENLWSRLQSVVDNTY